MARFVIIKCSTGSLVPPSVLLQGPAATECQLREKIVCERNPGDTHTAIQTERLNGQQNSEEWYRRRHGEMRHRQRTVRYDAVQTGMEGSGSRERAEKAAISVV